ncbi:MAG: hypothetical protein IKU86_12755 [Thermoguttaceae bacterium]|nr:hypothetical protein [Thermoguttaceae bacterium]
MKKTDAILVLATLATLPFVTTFIRASESNAPAVATQIFASSDQKAAIETRAVFYPTELAFGDVGYFATFERNVADDTIATYQPFEFELAKHLKINGITLTSPDVFTRYELAPELATRKFFTKKFPPRLGALAPGAERRKVAVALEFPPLEDWNAPFWKEIRDKLSTQESVELRLCVKFKRSHADYPLQAQVDETFETKIVLKRRAGDELERLSQWFDATPPRLFPERFTNGDGDGFVKAPSESGSRDVKSSGASDVEIGGKSYAPWLFVRVGNRKPSDPNNPTTVDDWRRLEAEFAPSTLRDEITLTRLQLEYYDAPEGEATDAALKRLLDWLRDRPEPQRAVLTESLLSKRAAFFKTPLKEKNATLCNAVTSDAFGQASDSNDAQ